LEKFSATGKKSKKVLDKTFRQEYGLVVYFNGRG
jgi:hypothetical protein